VNDFNIKGIAHITGGGLYENIPRIIPENLCAVIQKENIPPQELFHLLQNRGNIEESEMYGTFNMGVGLILVVNADQAAAVLEKLKGFTHPSFLLGEITKNQETKIIIQ
jgi:phosphoribosylformylglycinamidine cyclo-ligase